MQTKNREVTRRPDRFPAESGASNETHGNGDGEGNGGPEVRVGVVAAVTPLNLRLAEFIIRGTSPYCHCRMSAKIAGELEAAQEIGSASKAKKKRSPKDFAKLCAEATHFSTEGWVGIPATAFRNAAISACRGAGYVMKNAKQAIFVIADGWDSVDGVPLVKFTKGEPKQFTGPMRLKAGGTDIRSRPRWDPGWEARVVFQYDADALRLVDLANLIHRAGQTVGIGEGRHDSRDCNGCGWGCFIIINSAALEKL